MALPLLFVAIVLLFCVFIPGIGVSILGAKRWINTHVFLLQPAEFVKLALAIYLAAWFSNKEKERSIAFFGLLGTIMVLIMLEPDMGTAAIILSEALIMYFLEGAKLTYFFYSIPVLGIISFILVKLAPYRAARLSTFFNASSAPETASYHIRQILIALGMGGITGVGLGNSLQKYAYLPESTTDSIFAIIAEEIGFLGSIIFLSLFIIVIWRGFFIAIHAKDQFGRLLAGGIISFLSVQTIINLTAQTALLPLTGVPLPFVSYGGSSLLVDLSAIGILLNIGRLRHKTHI